MVKEPTSAAILQMLVVGALQIENVTVMHSNERYLAALSTNLDLLQRGHMAWICLQGFQAAGDPTHLVAKLCFNALFNDYLSKCAKVFEERRQVASIWYVERCSPEAFMQASGDDNSALHQMRSISKKLKRLRDGDLMHIDEAGVLDRHAVWASAAVECGELQRAVVSGIRILRSLCEVNGLARPLIPDELTGARTTQVARYFYAYMS